MKQMSKRREVFDQAWKVYSKAFDEAWEARKEALTQVEKAFDEARDQALNACREAVAEAEDADKHGNRIFEVCLRACPMGYTEAQVRDGLCAEICEHALEEEADEGE